MPKNYSVDLLDEVVSSVRSLAKPDVVPQGWYTTKQMASHADLSVSRMEKLVIAGVSAGTLETKKFRVQTSTGRFFPTPHYRKIQK
jgi:hypothetical protein